MKYFLLIVIILTNLDIKSQYLANPSFEGNIGWSTFPPDWTGCDSLSTPDTCPVEVSEGEPTDGDTFLALISRGASSPYANHCEDIQTQLLKPLLKGECYSLSIDIFNAKNYYFESLPVIFEILGGNGSCEETELFVRTKPITNDTWKNYTFLITPTIDDINFLILRVDYATDTIYFGNVMIDNIIIEQKKAKHIIQSDTSVIYNETLSLNASTGENYLWKPEIGLDCIDCQNINISNSFSTRYRVDYTKDDECYIELFNIEYNLSETLLKNECYSLEIDLFNQKSYGNAPSPINLEIWGGDENCNKENLILKTEQITNDTSLTYTYSIAQTNDNIDCVVLKEDHSFDLLNSGYLIFEKIFIEQKEKEVRVIDTSVIYNQPFTLNASPGEIYSWIPEIGIDCTDCQNATISTPVSTRYAVNYINEGVCYSEEFQISYKLLENLLKNECYSLSIDLFNQKSHGNETTPPYLEISRANENCNSNDLIIKTEPITNDTFQTFTYSIPPSTENTNCLTITQAILSDLISVDPVIIDNIIIEQKERHKKEIDIITDYNQPLLLSASNGGNYSWKPESGVDCFDCQNVNINEIISNTYTVDFINKDNCYREIFNIDFKLLIPNTITPNNDGFNDYFNIIGLEENSELTIINRQGIEVYKSYDYDNTWDAEYEGKKLKPDTYWYTLKVPSKPEPYAGFIYVTY